MADPTYNSGWTGGPAGGSLLPFQYRLDAHDNLVMTGTFHSTNTTPSATVFTLPTGYRPAIGQRVHRRHHRKRRGQQHMQYRPHRSSQS